MIRELLDKLYDYKLHDEKDTAINILTTHVTDLQMQALYELDSEVSETIADLLEPPDADEVAARNPTMDTGFEE